ncbi:AAA family ATPase [Allorhizobium sp. BGMRC 0089]|uniref:AAA family ATPase n=1 Tax=Allorhizobium sonneratiae TaxID=2934936 RepID=UPI00203372A9|nr:AAA family ATPase [Allorhizobium sonneratiae]MCM2291430.1 AAA family ATPase [Allorhizobium sonneratiae]
MIKKKKEAFVDLSSVEAREVSWLMPPIIPYGMITVMEGDPGIGKSFLAMHIAAQISIGGSLPGVPKVKKGRVLYISAEDDPAYTIRPRIDAMGGDPRRIRIQGDYTALDEAGLTALFAEVRRKPPALIIIDPLFAYVGSDKDMYRPNVIRALLSELKEIAEESGTAILLVRHLTKTKRDKAIYQGMGSMDVIGAARSAFLVTVHPDYPDQRLMLHVKHNIAERGQSWAYELKKENEDAMPVLNWIGPSHITVDDLMVGEEGGRKSAMDEAKDFLKAELKDRSQSATELLKKAEGRQISKRTLDRAREEIGVIARKRGKEWVWSLPDGT